MMVKGIPSSPAWPVWHMGKLRKTENTVVSMYCPSGPGPEQNLHVHYIQCYWLRLRNQMSSTEFNSPRKGLKLGLIQVYLI